MRKLAALTVLIALYSAPAQAQSTLRVAGANAPIERVQGHRVISSAALTPLGGQLLLDGWFARLALFGDTITFFSHSPFLRTRSGTEQLVSPAIRTGSTLWLPVQFFTEWLPGRYPTRVTWRDGALTAQPAVARGPVGPARESTAAERSPAPVAVRTPRVVVLDAGHGGKDPGKPGPNGVLEKNVALAVTNRLAGFLRERGYEVHLTRTRDTLIALDDRPHRANEWKNGRPAAVFLSIHANSGVRGSRGFETYILSPARTDDERRVAEMENAAVQYEERAPSNSPSEVDLILSGLKNDFYQRASHNLAELIQGNLGTIHPGPNRGVKQAGFRVLVGAVMPAVLVEVGFLSDSGEARLLGTAAFQQKLAWSMAQAVDRFFSLHETVLSSCIESVMKIRSFCVVATLAALASTSACAYYNSMYNANRLFDEAEKAAARGELGTARTAWQNSIEKAATSVRRHPDSQWSDDARLLMARAHLQLGDAMAARRQLLELLQEKPDPERRAAAGLYLGIIDAEVADDESALTRLNAALESPPGAARLRAAAFMARARVHYRARDWNAARADVQAAHKAGVEALRTPATLLGLRVSLAAHDSLSARDAWTLLLRDPATQRWTDSLPSLAQATASTFSAAFARTALNLAADAPWRAPARDSLLLLRSALVLQSGDTASALAELDRMAAHTTGAMADESRVQSAQWRLARVTDLENLADIRATLLPAIADQRARSLIQALKTLDVLTAQSRAAGQPLALFAAAELARDELRAPKLAARLFLDYARQAPQTPWAAKALLAAGALDPERSDELRAQAERFEDSPYIALLAGRTDADASYQEAEERLSRTLQVLLSDAASAAAARETTVNRAAAAIDSVRLAAHLDSARVACGLMIDSLAVAGIRADSIRSACLRNDRPRVAVLLKADTLMLRD